MPTQVRPRLVLLLLLVLLTMSLMRSTRRVPRLAPVLLAVGLVVLPAPVRAAGSDDLGNRMRDARGQLDGATRDELRALASLRSAQAARRDVEARIAALDARTAAVDRRLAEARAEAGRIEGEYRALRARLDDIRALAVRARRVLAAYAAQVYRNNGSGAAAIATLIDADDPSEIAVGNHYLEGLAGERDREVDRYLALRRDVERREEQLIAKRGNARRARRVAEAERTRLAALRSEQEAAHAAAAVRESEEQALLGGIQARKAEYERRVAALQAESDAVAAALQARRPGPASPPPARGSGRLRYPINAPVTSEYGWRVHPVYGTRKLHAGMDFGAAYGSAIHAAGSGVVVTAGWMGGYGNAVVIDHGGGVATLYGHQSRLAVSAGRRVSAGQVVGYVGSTGLSTGPHLHFEVRVNGSPVNPRGYL